MRKLLIMALILSCFTIESAGATNSTNATINATNTSTGTTNTTADADLEKEADKIKIEISKENENPVVKKNAKKKNKRREKNQNQKSQNQQNWEGNQQRNQARRGKDSGATVYKRINFQAGQDIVSGSKQVTTYQGVKVIDAQAVVKAFFSNSGTPVTALNYSEKTTQKQTQPQYQQTQGIPQNKEVSVKQLEGYCYFDRDIEMTTASLPVEIPCTFEDFDALLSGKLLADPTSASLLFKPEVLILDNGKRIPVQGYAMTQDRSSLNIADEVNKQYLKKIATAMASAGATGVLNGYKEYVQSKYSTTYATGDTTVTETNYPANYPWIVGLLSALDAGVNAITSIIQTEMSKVPVIFKVYKNKGIYVNLQTSLPTGSSTYAIKNQQQTTVNAEEKGKKDLLTGRTLIGDCYLMQSVSLEEGQTISGSLACKFPSVNISGVLDGEWKAKKGISFIPEKFSTGGKVYTASGNVSVKYKKENGLYVVDGDRFNANITVGRRIQ